MNLIECSDIPDLLNSQQFSPFANVAPPELQLENSKFKTLQSSCGYFSLPSMQDTKKSSHHGLNIIHINARSICSNDKFEELQLFLTRSQCVWHIICITETWLSDNQIPNRQLPGYTGYFENRKDKMGGGVAVYINTELVKHSLRSTVRTMQCTQSVIVKCQVDSYPTCIVGAIYKPPDLDSDIFHCELEILLEDLTQENKTTFLAGDFNHDLFNIANNNKTLEFFNTLACNGFWPTIFKTTRISDERCSLLDNIFCNNIELVSCSGIIYEDLSDHFPIFACAFPHRDVQGPEAYKQIFNESRMHNLKDYITEHLQKFSQVTDPNTASNMLIDAYSSGIRMFSTKVKCTRKSKAIKPWITPAILTSINRRVFLYKEKNKNPTIENKLAYNRHRNYLNIIIKVAKKTYFQNQFKENKSNSKKMWELLKNCAMGDCSRQSLPRSFMDENGVQLDDENEIAASFNKYFISVGEGLQNEIPACSTDPLSYITTDHSQPLSKFEPTNPAELHSIIKAMKNVGSGIDGINAKIFKATYSAIISELVHLVNLCLEKGMFPENMKIAVVKPIYKAGNQSRMCNYRPISILPYVSKLLEKIIHQRLMEYLLHHNILATSQFGFQSSLSTYMPILLLQDSITKVFEKGSIAIALYMDFKKAFDTVDHSILIGKCNKYGIVEQALSLIESYLTNRKQCVEYNGVRSSIENVNIGVPQGSILGPLLFLLYINDLPSISKVAQCLLYADDTVFIFESATAFQLQNVINFELPIICTWLQANKLSLNTRKTVYQIYNNSRIPSELNVTLNGDPIEAVQSVKYLGMIIDPHLKWNLHIDHLTTIISRNIGVMNRSKFFLDTHLLILLYNSLILPYINYCCVVWGFTFPSYLNKIELLQKRAVRIITHQHRLAHTEQIFKSLKLLKVHAIAKQQAIILLHRKLTLFLPTHVDGLFTLNDCSDARTRNPQHFIEPFTKRLYCTRNVTWLGPRIWNKIMATQFNIQSIMNMSKLQVKKLSKEYFLENFE